MKNRIFIFLIIICSFFVVDRVSAETLIFDYENSNLDLLKDNLSIVEEIRELSNDFNINNYTYYISYNKKSGVYYLTFGIGNYSCSNAFYTVSYSFNNDRDLYNGEFSYLNGDNIFCDGYIGKGTQQNYIELNLSNYDESTKNEFLNNVKNYFVNGASSFSSMQSQTYQYKSNLNVFSNNNFSVPVYSNANLKFVKKYNDTKNYEKIIQIGDNLYNYNDIIPTYYDYFGLGVPQIPTIDISMENTLFNENNEPIQSKISIDWKIKDLTKYKYLWKKDTDSNWKQFITDAVIDEILINKNGNYLFQVNDQEDNYITSSTLSITNLTDILPTIKLNDYTGTGCYFENQKICTILTLYSENADFSKYTLQYRFNNGEWFTHNYDNSVKGQIQIYENTTLTARLIRNSDNELIDSANYTITSINTDVSLDIPEIKFDKTFCTDITNSGSFVEYGSKNYKQTLKMTIYGLDTSKYKVYISENNANDFTEIVNFEYEDRVPLVKYYYFEYYQDTTFIIKITDLEDNYVTGVSYTLHFTCEDYTLQLGDELNTVDDIFSKVKTFFDKFKNIMLKIRDVIEYFYNSMNDEIKGFILTAFILIIVCNLINSMKK